MQTDITLTIKDRTLIIDTKYYGQNTQTNFDKQTILSGNLYQIHTYVMNAEQHHSVKGKVDGMLLYAQTQSNVQPYLHFQN
ncbi:restriction enzyme modulator protein, partial [gut metagenome]